MIKTAASPVHSHQAVSRPRAASIPWLPWIVFAFIHAPLALMLDLWPGIATIHALSALGAGLWFLVRDNNPVRVLYVCGYIAGAEVLWRMTDAGVNWEYGKYAIAFLSLLAILRWRGKLSPWPILYLLLMAPSIVTPFFELRWSLARRAVSFNLSASLALTLFMLFAGNVRLSTSQFRSLLQALICPIVGIATLALRNLLTHAQIRFTNESNFVASGGYGPNQVSAVLGLGALACWLILLLSSRDSRRWGVIYLGIMLWLVSHALLTFSRGGVVNFVAGVLASVIYLGRRHAKLILTAVVLFLAFSLLIFPYLNRFTGGMLETRLRDLDPTGRDVYVRVDMDIWKQHPILGVGAGMAPFHRAVYLGFDAGTHTEFTRLFAEHGLLGLSALIILAYSSWKAYRATPSSDGRTLILAFLAWTLTEMGHSATRIAVIPFCLGVIVIVSNLSRRTN